MVAYYTLLVVVEYYVLQAVVVVVYYVLQEVVAHCLPEKNKHVMVEHHKVVVEETLEESLQSDSWRLVRS